jgi:hypothetical protein
MKLAAGTAVVFINWPSDKELREALERLGYKPDEITYAFG